MLYLSNSEIEKVVSTVGINTIMDEIITEIKQCFSAPSPAVIHKVRDGFLDEKKQNLIEWMPVYRQEQSATIKLVSYFPENPVKNDIETIQAVICQIDHQTGLPCVVADGRLITAMRTGAASAVASEVMSNSRVPVIGLIGCGAQSVTQVHALSRIFDISTIYAFDICVETQRQFSQHIQALGIDIPIVFEKPESILAIADILCTATSAPVDSPPVIPMGSYKEGLHINAVGSDCPGKIELPRALLDKAVIIPDSIDQAKNEGECQQLGIEPEADIFNLLRHRPVVRHFLTVFDSTGLAIEDALGLDIIAKYALELGYGQRSKTPLPLSSKNPYSFLGRQYTKDTGDIAATLLNHTFASPEIA